MTSISLMQPMLIPDSATAKFYDLVLELTEKSTSFRSSLLEGMQENLANMIRSMNCYYSNLIEGHNTHPLEIEKALKKDFNHDIEKRNLQLEAVAHIQTQKWIDEGGLKGKTLLIKSICEIHKKFYEELPEELSRIDYNGRQVRIIPGELRNKDVQVGNHIAVDYQLVGKFLEHFSDTYNQLSKAQLILNSAAIHHRFLWIHPFLDGNGRVARLLNYSLFLETLNTSGLWSVARGLARNTSTYKALLANCDLSRRNDLDGRGNLSLEALEEFTSFFLKTCIDQVDFMAGLMQAKNLKSRILLWAKEAIESGDLPVQSFRLMEILLYKGEIFRSEVSEILNLSSRHSRRILSILLKKEIIEAKNTKAPFRLNFPIYLSARWMPGLFPA